MPTHRHTKIMCKRTHPRHRHNSRGRPHQHAPSGVTDNRGEIPRTTPPAPASSHHNHNTAPERVGRCALPRATGTDPAGRSALPTGRTHARASLHPRQQQREPPPRARTHFQATSKTQTTLGRGHVRSHPARLRGLTQAVTVLRATLLACRHRTLEAGTTPRNGDLGERVTEVLETRKRQPLTPPQP